MRVCDIDFERRRVDVRRAFSDVGGHVVLGTPKSHQSRTVPIPPFVATDLAAAICGKHADGLVFTMPSGSVVRLSNWRRAVFLPARDRAGVSTRFRIHEGGRPTWVVLGKHRQDVSVSDRVSPLFAALSDTRRARPSYP